MSHPDVRDHHAVATAVARLRMRRSRLGSRAHRGLLEQEARFRLLAEFTDDVFWFMELRPPRMLYLSPAYERIWGGPVEVVYRNPAAWQAAVHPEDLSRVHAAVERCYRGETIEYRAEYRIVRPDGQVRWIEDRGTVAGEGTAGSVWFGGIARDITERKRSEEALRLSEERFRALVETTTDWIWEVDPQGIYTYVSPRVKELLGYDVEEVVGKTPMDLMPPKEVARLAPIIRRHMAKARPFRNFENLNRHRSGRLVMLETSGTPILEPGGQLSGYRGIDRDITSRKRIQRQLEEAKRVLEDRVAARTADLRRMNQELEQTSARLCALAQELVKAEQRERRRVAGVLHDGLQQLLVGARFGLANARARGRARSFRSALDQVDELLNRCLEASRSLTLELSPPILYERGLSVALKWLGQWFQQTHGLVVRFVAGKHDLGESEELRVALFEVVRELLLNVVKHARVVEARLSLHRLAGGRARLVVSDRGVGFDPAAVTSHRRKNGGVGLFRLRERVRLLGGQLDITSVLGRGSRFTLIVPLQRPAE